MAVPLLLLGLTITETGHWLITRQVVRLALHEAARAGATQHGHPEAIHAAFEHALNPLYVPAGPHGTPQARRQASHEQLRRSTGLAPWRLDIVGPPAAAYQDFGSASHTYGARLAIANDYLAEQHARAQTRWPQGVGPHSGLTIHQANVLHLRLSYLKRPFTPIMGAVLKTLAWAAPEHTQAALEAGLLSMHMESRMTMQSDPVAWESAASGPVSYPDRSWLPTPAPGTPQRPPHSALPVARNNPPAFGPDSAVRPALKGPAAPSSTDEDKALCSVVLCCGPGD